MKNTYTQHNGYLTLRKESDNKLVRQERCMKIPTGILRRKYFLETWDKPDDVLKLFTIVCLYNDGRIIMVNPDYVKREEYLEPKDTVKLILGTTGRLVREEDIGTIIGYAVLNEKGDLVFLKRADPILNVNTYDVNVSPIDYAYTLQF